MAEGLANYEIPSKTPELPYHMTTDIISELFRAAGVFAGGGGIKVYIWRACLHHFLLR